MGSLEASQQAMLQRMNAMKMQAGQGASTIMPSSESNQTQQGNVVFSDVMRGVIHSVDDKQQISSKMATDIETGASDDLVGTMVAQEKASLSFSALMQVRNKLVNSYDDIMNMQL